MWKILPNTSAPLLAREPYITDSFLFLFSAYSTSRSLGYYAIQNVALIYQTLWKNILVLKG